MEFDIDVLLQWLEQDRVMVGIISVALIINVCYYWGMWHVFRKMGIAGWKCLIPIYNPLVLYKIVWTGAAFWYQFSLRIMVTGLLVSDIPYREYIAIGGIILWIIIELMFLHKLSKTFGHGILFTLGLAVCPPLFYMILGLGSSQFQLFGSSKLRKSTITIGGREYPIHDFDKINKLQRNDKKAAAVVELSKLTGITYEEAVAVLDKWYLYYY